MALLSAAHVSFVRACRRSASSRRRARRPRGCAAAPAWSRASSAPRPRAASPARHVVEARDHRRLRREAVRIVAVGADRRSTRSGTSSRPRRFMQRFRRVGRLVVAVAVLRVALAPAVGGLVEARRGAAETLPPGASAPSRPIGLAGRRELVQPSDELLGDLAVRETAARGAVQQLPQLRRVDAQVVRHPVPVHLVDRALERVVPPAERWRAPWP